MKNEGMNELATEGRKCSYASKLTAAMRMLVTLNDATEV
jgi:hypothetical protein